MNMKHYNNLKTLPADALKPILAGRLKGKSDINPQWRVEAMTKEFGVCGIGWKYEIAETWTVPASGDQLLIFAQINLYVKDGEAWSAAIPAIGGDFVVKKETSGLYVNDESYKMAVTDALGVAMKFLGVAADVYRGLANDTKYGREKPQQLPAKTNVSPTPQIPATAKLDGMTVMQMAHLVNLAKEKSVTADMPAIMQKVAGVGSTKELTKDQADKVICHLQELVTT
jgi:hypothetical protein